MASCCSDYHVFPNARQVCECGAWNSIGAYQRHKVDATDWTPEYRREQSELQKRLEFERGLYERQERERERERQELLARRRAILRELKGVPVRRPHPPQARTLKTLVPKKKKSVWRVDQADPPKIRLSLPDRDPISIPICAVDVIPVVNTHWMHDEMERRALATHRVAPWPWSQSRRSRRYEGFRDAHGC
jgi:hypothetical protein